MNFTLRITLAPIGGEPVREPLINECTLCTCGATWRVTHVMFVAGQPASERVA